MSDLLLEGGGRLLLEGGDTGAILLEPVAVVRPIPYCQAVEELFRADAWQTINAVEELFRADAWQTINAVEELM